MSDCTALPLYDTPALRRIEQRHAEEPLMERAGLAAAELATELAAPGGAVLIFAGPGNNGGDALVVARLLRERFFTVSVVFAGDATQLPADAHQAWVRLVASGQPLLRDIPAQPPAQTDGCWSLIIDGLFGIGLSRPVEGIYADWIRQANQLAQRDSCPLLALDTPSGLNADTGQALGDCIIEASHTLTFIAAKPGLYTADGPDFAGDIRIAALALEPLNEEAPTAWRLSRQHVAHALRPRRRNSHKGSHGGAGVLGGAPGMVGAALLAGRAALLLGAGRVWIGLGEAGDGSPEITGGHGIPSLMVDLQHPELMLRTATGVLALPAPDTLTALAIGPGLGTGSAARHQLRQALAFPGPLLLDADALNLLAGHPSLQQAARERAAQQHPTLLTPHPSEAARLLGTETGRIQADRLHAARQMASRFQALVALKGCGTVIASPSGEVWINTSGNAGLATAGSGDVLTGMTLALLAQGWPATAALCAAVHLHGAAADMLVSAGHGPVGLTANELALPARELLNRWLA